jgi:7-cyano-7-deazaguanine synthase
VKIIAVVSGGMDSITMLHRLAKDNTVKVISFDYGQRHIKELKMAKYNAKKLGLEHKIIKMSFLRDIASHSSLTSKQAVPEGHYENKNMKATVVPNRNMIMASIATAWAINESYDAIALGVHSGDHAIYPDCRPTFIKALRRVLSKCDYKPIKVVTPYLKADKTKIVADGLQMGVNYKKTWTCYKGLDKACGKCGSCQERLEAFTNNQVIDPLEYETRRPIQKR